MNDEIRTLGIFNLYCPNCGHNVFYHMVNYPKDAVCPSCGQSFPLSEYERSEILERLTSSLCDLRPAATLKLKPLCELLKKAAEEKMPYIRLYSVKDPSENASFPLLALFAAPRDKTEEYLYLGSVKTW